MWTQTFAILCIAMSAGPPMSAKTHQEGVKRTVQPTIESTWSLRTESDAISAAKAILGLGDGEHGRLISFLVVDDPSLREVPFLHEQYRGLAVWRVDVKYLNFELVASSTPPEENRPSIVLKARRATLCLRASDGALLRMSVDVQPWDENMPADPPDASVESMEQQMRDTENEVWRGPPTTTPKQTVKSVLATIYRDMGGVLGAKSMLIYPVRLTSGGKPEALKWSVECRGLSRPAESAGSFNGRAVKLQAWQNNHLRHIVDDASGAWEGSGTCPQPAGGSKEQGNDRDNVVGSPRK